MAAAPIAFFSALSQGLTFGGALGAANLAGWGSTLGALSLGGAALSSVSSFQASSYQAAAEESRLRSQAAADEYNRTIALQNAEIVGQQTQAAMEKADRERRLRMGAARASGGASGVGLESFGDILQSSATQETLDLLTIKSEGALKKREFTTQAELLGSSARSTRSQVPLVQRGARASKAANVISGVSSGLTSFSKLGAL